MRNAKDGFKDNNNNSTQSSTNEDMDKRLKIGSLPTIKDTAIQGIRRKVIGKGRKDR